MNNKEIDIEEVSSKRLRNRLIFGSLAILACFAMILGVMYSISFGEKKVREIVLIVFWSLLAASLVIFYVYVIIEYLIKKSKLKKAEEEKKIVDKKPRDDWK